MSSLFRRRLHYDRSDFKHSDLSDVWLLPGINWFCEGFISSVQTSQLCDSLTLRHSNMNWHRPQNSLWWGRVSSEPQLSSLHPRRRNEWRTGSGEEPERYGPKPDNKRMRNIKTENVELIRSQINENILLCENSYLFHCLIEENQLLGSISNKELLNQRELEESHRVDFMENSGNIISESFWTGPDGTLSSEMRASSTSGSPRVPASTNLLIKYLCRASSVARLSSFMALACFAISLLASLDSSMVLLPDTWTEDSWFCFWWKRQHNSPADRNNAASGH